MKITILADTPKSWIFPWAEILKYLLQAIGKYNVVLVDDQSKIMKGDIAFLLGCTKIVSEDILYRNDYNIVIHPSNLPYGKGFSPLAWQLLEGKNEIVMTLFDATPELDAGDIYLQETIIFKGDELNDEIKKKQGYVTLSLCLKFLMQLKGLIPIKQNGKSTFYPKRTKNDSELDVNQTIKQQFNLLRVVDNERYPAFFVLNGIKYEIQIKKVLK